LGEARLAASWLDGQNAGPLGTDDEDDEDESTLDGDEVVDEAEVVDEVAAGPEVVVVEPADLCDDPQPVTARPTASPRMTAVRFIEPPKIAVCLPPPRPDAGHGCSGRRPKRQFLPIRSIWYPDSKKLIKLLAR
jgi:hypothetical protein